MSAWSDAMSARVKALEEALAALDTKYRSGGVKRDEARLERQLARASAVTATIPLNIYENYGSVAAHEADTTAHPASSIVNTPAGGIAATTVQAAIDELDSEKQPLDATLTAFAGVTVAADKGVYATGADAFATFDLSAFARTLLDDANAAAARTTLGLVIGTDVQAQDAELAAIAGLISAADRIPYFTGLGAAALATFTSQARTFCGAVDAAAQRTVLGLGTAYAANVSAAHADSSAATLADFLVEWNSYLAKQRTAGQLAT